MQSKGGLLRHHGIADEPEAVVPRWDEVGHPAGWQTHRPLTEEWAEVIVN